MCLLYWFPQFSNTSSFGKLWEPVSIILLLISDRLDSDTNLLNSILFFLGRSCHFRHSFSHFHSVSRSILLLVFIPPLTKSLILSLCHFLCQHGIKSSSLPKALMKLIIWTLERQLRKSNDIIDDQLQY